jgi:hypothetical protein
VLSSILNSRSGRAESRHVSQELPKELAVMQAPERSPGLSLGSRASPFLQY